MPPMKVAIGQIAPVLLDRERTLTKIVDAVAEAGSGEAELVVFGETLLPGYPVWIGRTDGARFAAQDQKEYHSLYLEQAVDIGAGHLAPVQAAAKEHGITVCLGVAERHQHSVFAARVFIGADGEILSVHRKLRPTHEERLTWAPGDGAGLVVHPVGPFTVGGLNCWENWMPLARAALYAQGEDLHCMLWPGSRRNTEDITPVMAKEGRSYVISVSAPLRAADVPADFPGRDLVVPDADEIVHDGGSCIAAPDGSWVIEPLGSEEAVVIAEIDPARVREERQNFDPAGHYSRPDVLDLTVDRRRLGGARFVDGDGA
ncbi:MAG: carbon-nitrogen hydrolase family protein [Planctomycetota bacterium]|nr:carbon-nitrogen hydrolase family protein [Planctomycetota bacterium]